MYRARLYRKANKSAKHPGARMNTRLCKIGAIGTVITAICCFTPVLVWALGIIGLAAALAYLDYVLLPLLAMFFLLGVIGLVRKDWKEKTGDENRLHNDADIRPT